jgi:hypothetical protein
MTVRASTLHQTADLPGLRQKPPLLVAFRGDRGGEGPLTFGQRNILQWFSTAFDPVTASLVDLLEVPAQTTVTDVAECLATLVARHEGLRTHFLFGGQPRQRVAAAGSLAVAVHHLEQPAPRDAVIAVLSRQVQLALGTRMAADLRRLSDPIEPAVPADWVPQEWAPDDLPLRAAVAVEGGSVRGVVVAYSHLVVDAQAKQVLHDEFDALISGADRGPQAAVQPLDQATAEAGALWQRRAEAALDFWERALSRMPQSSYPAPTRTGLTGPTAVRLESASAAIALRHVAARLRTSRTSVVGAAVSAVLRARHGTETLLFPALSGNRFEPRLLRYVGTLVQGTVLEVRAAGLGFDDLVRELGTAAVRGGRHGRYDIDRRVALAQRIEWQRGVRFNYEPVFNSVVVDTEAGASPATLPAIPTGAAGGDLTSERVPPTEAALRLELRRLDDVMDLRAWTGDAARVSPDELTSLLRAVERLLVAAAGSDLSAAEVDAAIGLGRLDLGAGWTLVDSCWVEVAAVQRLLDDSFPDVPGRIFASVGGAPLVAHLVAHGQITTAERAHERCMSRLAGRMTAIAPQRYVLFGSAPADPDDPAAWSGAIAAGSGR